MRRPLILPALLLIAALSPAAPQAKRPLELARTISLPAAKGALTEIAYDAERRHLIVAAGADDLLEVVDAQTGAHLQTVIGMNKPRGIAVIPGLSAFSVTNAGDGSFKNFDAATFQIKKSIPLGENAECIRYDPVTRRIYAGYGRGSIAIIDPASNSRLGDLELTDHPGSFILENPGQRIFAIAGTKAQITVIDKGRNTLLAPLPLKGARSPAALALADKRLFIGCRKPAKMLIYDTETLRRVAEVPLPDDPGSISYDNVRHLLYVSSGGGSISVIAQKDPDHYRQTAKVPSAPGAVTSIFVQELDLLFLAVPRHGSQGARLDVYRAH